MFSFAGGKRKSRGEYEKEKRSGGNGKGRDGSNEKKPRRGCEKEG